MSEAEHTQVITVARDLDLVSGDRLHCLELIDCVDTGRRHVVGPLGLKIGRTPPADVVLLDSEVSRSHCVVALEGAELVVALERDPASMLQAAPCQGAPDTDDCQ